VIVFPELCLPQNHSTDTLALADQHNITIVAGLEAEWSNGRYSNIVAVRIPQTRQTMYQYKSFSSNDEPEKLLAKGGQIIFANTAVGTFSVVICSDYRACETMQVIEQCGMFIDFLLVCSMNPYPEAFQCFAMSDSRRLHSFVVIANNDGVAERDGQQSIGSGAYAPTREASASALKPTKVFLDASDRCGHPAYILLYDLPFEQLIRDRSKPQGFEAPHPTRLKKNSAPSIV
jgi:predicted amidohydrolase